MRTVVRSTLIAGMTGTLMVSAAWAGIGLAPVPVPSLPATAPSAPAAPALPVTAPASTDGAGSTQQGTAAATGLRVGASKASINPDPARMAKRYPGARWEQDLTKCTRLNPDQLAEDLPNEVSNVATHLASTGSPWPENPDCIYQGGYGLGPMFPVSKFDQTLGLWVRSIAIGDGADTFILTTVDGEGWLWDYKNKCTDCGVKQIAASLAADPELKAAGVTPASFSLSASHSHTAPDFIGGWGYVPDWYMAQVTDTIKATSKEAVLSMRAATLEYGSENARKHNKERRSTYRSAEEAELNWLRAVAVPTTTTTTPTTTDAADTTTDANGNKGNGRKASPSPSPAPTTEPAAPEVIATLGAFAAHPVTADESAGIAHPDWPGTFVSRAEQRFGGTGMLVMTGLGNVTGANPNTGAALADLIPAVGNADVANGSDVRFKQTTWRQPVTNVPLDALGTPGFFDRKFDNMPAKVAVSDGSPEYTPNPGNGFSQSACISASPQSVELPVSVLKIGQDLVLTTGPGELFGNLTNTIKEKAPNQVVFPLGQTNDALGYMPQSFEINAAGQQGLGFAVGGFLVVNYEDSYAVDRCVGDMVLESTIATMDALK